MDLSTQLKNIANKYTNGNGSAKLANGMSVIQMVGQELLKLERYIKDNINEYLNSYSPEQYQRTGAWLDSIYVTKATMASGLVTASIKFDDIQAYHPSVIGENQEFGYVPMLMETGWDISDKIGRDTPMFAVHKGTHYIRDAVNKFNSKNKYGIKVSVYFGDEQYI